MPEKGTACPVCGYVLRKWAVSCPKCRTRLGDDLDEERKVAGLDEASKRGVSYERDGLMYSPEEEWQIIERMKLNKISSGLGIYIPKKILDYLGLIKGMRLDIAFRKSQIQPNVSQNELFNLVDVKVERIKTGSIKKFLDVFLESKHNMVECPFKYVSVSTFLYRELEYQKKIVVKCVNFRKQNEYVWVEKRGDVQP